MLALTIGLAMLAHPVLRAAPPSEPLPLWPAGAPDETAPVGEEKDVTKPAEGTIAGKRVARLTNVSVPTLTVTRPPADRDTGAAVLVCPGGGYHILAMDLEGTEVVEWLNSIGVTGVLLKYRVPMRTGRERYAAPLQDAQRALGLIRQRAADWGIDPKRIGVMGFSAGGHLSAALSTKYGKRTYTPVDAADEVSCRPDFTMLIYPAYLTVEKEADRVASELQVTEATPPTFLVQTQDDVVRVETSLFYYLALKRAKVSAELHLYPTGGHGYGLRPTPEPVTSWPQRAEQWMRNRKILDRH
jgi:acetyl esterase/lipase